MIDNACVVCPKCGKQVAALKSEQPNIIINNSNENTNINHNQVGGYGRPKDKWISFFLCLFLGIFGGHKFYEGKIGAGILYLLTAGLCGVGVLVDLIILLFKPNPYYVSAKNSGAFYAPPSVYFLQFHAFVVFLTWTISGRIFRIVLRLHPNHYKELL